MGHIPFRQMLITYILLELCVTITRNNDSISVSLERIREIRASERKLYQKITDLYATVIDYDKNAAATRRFYATVQNKMHYAV